jgi:hypothetical protein
VLTDARDPDVSLTEARNQLALAITHLNRAGPDHSGAFALIQQRLDDLDRVLREPRTILIPAYFYPANAGTGVWQRVIEAAKKYKDRLRFVVIVNPDSGPPRDGKLDANYVSVLQDCQAAGVQCIGYLPVAASDKVGEKWVLRSGADLGAAVAAWTRVSQQVQLSGLFLDNLPEDEADDVGTIEDVCYQFKYDLRQKREPLIVGNPGKAERVEGWLRGKRKVVDNICIFERGAGFDSFELPKWTFKDRLNGRVSALAYNVKDESTASRSIRGLMLNGCTTFYVTDADSTEKIDCLQWGRLPRYWDQFLKAAATN